MAQRTKNCDFNKRAFAVFRIEKDRVRVSDSWTGRLPLTYFTTHHPAIVPYVSSGRLPSESHSREHHIPADRICPTCRAHKPKKMQWQTKNGFLPNCRSCWQQGIRVHDAITAEVISRTIMVSGNIKERRAARRRAIIAQYFGSPPACWHCRKQRKRFVIKAGFKPVCWRCWRNGVEIIFPDFLGLEEKRQNIS